MLAEVIGESAPIAIRLGTVWILRDLRRISACGRIPAIHHPFAPLRIWMAIVAAVLHDTEKIIILSRRHIGNAGHLRAGIIYHAGNYQSGSCRMREVTKV